VQPCAQPRIEQQCRKAAALHQFHDDVGRVLLRLTLQVTAEIMHGNNGRMAAAGYRPDQLPEAVEELRAHVGFDRNPFADLDRDSAVDEGVVGAVHCAHCRPVPSTASGRQWPIASTLGVITPISMAPPQALAGRAKRQTGAVR
jgi:hypothetical protein